MPQV
jgi:DNA helicase INO80